MPVLLVLLALVALPLFEILIFIEVGGEIGAGATIALTLATAVCGAALARFQGMNALTRTRAAVDRGEAPVAEVIGGLGILLGAVLLFVPGFATDALGLLLLVPPVRGLLLAGLVRRLAASRGARFRAGGGPVVIDGEFSDLDAQPREDPVITVRRDKPEDPAA